MSNVLVDRELVKRAIADLAYFTGFVEGNVRVAREKLGAKADHPALSLMHDAEARVVRGRELEQKLRIASNVGELEELDAPTKNPGGIVIACRRPPLVGGRWSLEVRKVDVPPADAGPRIDWEVSQAPLVARLEVEDVDGARDEVQHSAEWLVSVLQGLGLNVAAVWVS